jgi:hypothetical protein
LKKWNWAFAFFVLAVGILHIGTAYLGVKRAGMATRFSEGAVGPPVWVTGAAVAPSIVRVDFEKGVRGFNGSGGTDYYIWLFGWQRRILSTRWDS